MRTEGYAFKKGYSRSNSSASSNSDSGHPPLKLKRAKRNSEERVKETNDLTSLLENVKSHLQIKQKRLEKAKSVQDFKLCDQLTLEIRKLLKEKSDHERQITAIQRKEAKSLWYHKTKSSKKEKKELKSGKVVNKPLTKFLLKDTSADKVITSSSSTSAVSVPLEANTSASFQTTAQVDLNTCTSSETAVEPLSVIDAPLSPTDTLTLSGSAEDSDF